MIFWINIQELTHRRSIWLPSSFEDKCKPHAYILNHALKRLHALQVLNYKHRDRFLIRPRDWLHGEFLPGLMFQPGCPGWKKNAITWEISARAETECEGGNRCFLYLLLYTKVLRMRLWIFSPGWNFLSITWGILARSTVISGSSNRAETPYYKDFIGSLVWTFSPVNLAESSSRAENPHVISP